MYCGCLNCSSTRHSLNVTVVRDGEGVAVERVRAGQSNVYSASHWEGHDRGGWQGGSMMPSRQRACCWSAAQVPSSYSCGRLHRCYKGRRAAAGAAALLAAHFDPQPWPPTHPSKRCSCAACASSAATASGRARMDARSAPPTSKMTRGSTRAAWACTAACVAGGEDAVPTGEVAAPLRSLLSVRVAQGNANAKPWQAACCRWPGWRSSSTPPGGARGPQTCPELGPLLPLLPSLLLLPSPLRLPPGQGARTASIQAASTSCAPASCGAPAAARSWNQTGDSRCRRHRCRFARS